VNLLAPWQAGDSEQRWNGYLVAPGSDVLRNKIGATTKDQLQEAENDLVEFRVAELRERPGLVNQSFDLPHLRSIHRHLFQDVYEWAGELRTVGLAKGGGESFMPPAQIERPMLHAQDHIRDLRARWPSASEIPGRLAYIYDFVNFAHPFREGNGRTQREFFTQLLAERGLRLAWERVESEELHAACHAARNDGDLEPLTVLMAAVLK
jgi:cell filamentation protein